MQHMVQASTYSRLSEIAEDQWGLITRSQAKKAGISPSTLNHLMARGGFLERVSHGVYRLHGTPNPDHIELRAAWIQLAPQTPAWARTSKQGVISHRSAASVYGIGDFTADRHEFTLAKRRQSRRRDVRIHQRAIKNEDCRKVSGLLITRPSRLVSDLLYDHEEPDAVAEVITDAIRGSIEEPAEFVRPLASHALSHGFRRNNGLAVLRWLLELTENSDGPHWLTQARQGTSDVSSVPAEDEA